MVHSNRISSLRIQLTMILPNPIINFPFMFLLFFHSLISFSYSEDFPDDSWEYTIGECTQNVTYQIIEQSESLNIQNTCFNSIESSFDSGGAIQATRVETTILNCVFTSCFSGILGGAVYVRITGQRYLFPLNLKNSTFINNYATYSGGAVYVQHSRDEIRSLIDYCMFENNGAGLTAGALYLDIKGYVYVRYCYFSNNTAVANGTTLFLQSGLLNPTETNVHHNILRNCYFEINNQKHSDIGVFLTGFSNGELRMRNCQFLFYKNDVDSENTLVETPTNYSVEPGIGFLFYAATDSQTNITFNGCICMENHRFIFHNINAQNFQYMVFDCTNASAQCSEYTGGGDESSTSSTPRPTATTYIPTPSASVDLNPECYNLTNFHHNYYFQFSQIILDHVCFCSIMTQGSGGAVWVIQSPTYLRYCWFDNCYAAENGGGMYYKSTEYEFSFTIARSNFTNCIAQVSGGGLYYYSTKESQTDRVRYCNFYSCIAQTARGGGMVLVSRGNTLVELCRFECNRASINGASVCVICGSRVDNVFDNTPSEMTDCVFYVLGRTLDNISVSSLYVGGNPNGRFTISGCTFSTSTGMYDYVNHVLNDRELISFNSLAQNYVYGPEKSVQLFVKENIKYFNFTGVEPISTCSSYSSILTSFLLPNTGDDSQDTEENDNNQESLVAGVISAGIIVFIVIIIIIVCKQVSPSEEDEEEIFHESIADEEDISIAIDKECIN